MYFVKLSIVFLALIALLCFANGQPKEVTELEEAALNILTNCYADRGKTILVVGSFPRSFVHKLTSRGLFSLAFLDTKRPMNNINHGRGYNGNTLHKVDIIIMQAWKGSQSRHILPSLIKSRYYNHMASFLVIGFPTEERSAACDGKMGTFEMLFRLHVHSLQNAILLCVHHEYGKYLYSFNAYGGQAPKPWRLVASGNIDGGGPKFSAFIRKYHENNDMCENLYYDKTHDLGGYSVTIVHQCFSLDCSREAIQIHEDLSLHGRYERIQNKKSTGYIKDFLVHVNATSADVYQKVDKGRVKITMGIHLIRGLVRELVDSWFIYPYEMECFYLVTRHRGNKSQVQKIIALIDIYSWIGIAVVCVMSLMFFKYFFRQPLSDAVLNIVRLCSNFGIPMVPQNLASRIYMACLLFFVVTMQGIFVSNLAALLTQDIPLQHVESFQDVADFGYTPYTYSTFFSYFNDYLPKENVHHLNFLVPWFEKIEASPWAVCLVSKSDTREIVAKHHWHASRCVIMEHTSHRVERFWPLEERMHKFLLNSLAGGVLIPLDYIVDEKRLIEAEAAHIDPEPRKLTLNDLVFAFVILGVGSACALVTFLVELLIHWYHRRVRRTRVQILN